VKTNVMFAVMVALVLASGYARAEEKKIYIPDRTTGAIETQCLNGFLFAIATIRGETDQEGIGISIVQVFGSVAGTGYIPQPVRCR